ncbi:MAG: hypothetical protein U1F26_18955 [Lysobacterales bacterium]
MRILLCALLLLGATGARAGQWLSDQVFDRYSPLVAADEFSRRVFTPTTHDRLQRFQAYLGRHAVEQTVDLAAERYDVYLPSRQPPAGYGLLVFVSPMDQLPLSRDWKKVLDRVGVIYVAARRSGNRENVYERRIPLALHAVETLRARYPIDAERITIGGYSGGSRTAIRIAAAYADVFTGALLVGGAKVMGEEDFAPPPAALMTLLQRRMRIVYSTGSEDMPNLRLDARSRAALAAHCVAGVYKISERGIGHELPDRKTLERVYARLDRPLEPEALAEQARCATDLAARAEAAMVAAEQAYAEGRITEAGELLGAADLAWGGLMADRLIALARKIAPGFSEGAAKAAQ